MCLHCSKENILMLLSGKMLEVALQIATVHRVVERKACEVTVICPILNLLFLAAITLQKRAETGMTLGDFSEHSPRIPSSIIHYFQAHPM